MQEDTVSCPKPHGQVLPDEVKTQFLGLKHTEFDAKKKTASKHDDSLMQQTRQSLRQGEN